MNSLSPKARRGLGDWDVGHVDGNMGLGDAGILGLGDVAHGDVGVGDAQEMYFSFIFIQGMKMKEIYIFRQLLSISIKTGKDNSQMLKDCLRPAALKLFGIQSSPVTNWQANISGRMMDA